MLKIYRFACLNASFNGKSYSKELNNALPNHSGVSKENLTTYLTKCGLENIRIKDLNHIRDIQSKHLPWFLKFSFHYDTYAVYGTVKKQN